MALSLAMLGFGCGADREESFEVRRASGLEDFHVSAATDGELQLLREIAGRTNPVGLESISLEDAGSRDVGVFTAEGTKWLRFEYAAFADGPSYVEPYWRSGLIAVAYRRAALEEGLSLVRGWTVAGPDFEDSFQISSHPFTESMRQPDLDVEALLERLRSERSETLRVVSLEVLQPFRSAAAVVIETTDPIGFFREGSRDLGAVVGSGPFGDGNLVRVVDTEGHAVWSAGIVLGAGSSVKWAPP